MAIYALPQLPFPGRFRIVPTMPRLKTPNAFNRVGMHCHLRHGRLLRGACHRARVRATRWLAMTEEAAKVADLLSVLSGGTNAPKRLRKAATKTAREDRC
jgi:hypothetical protein